MTLWSHIAKNLPPSSLGYKAANHLSMWCSATNWTICTDPASHPPRKHSKRVVSYMGGKNFHLRCNNLCILQQHYHHLESTLKESSYRRKKHRPGISSTKKAFQKSCLIWEGRIFISAWDAVQQIVLWHHHNLESTQKESSHRGEKTTKHLITYPKIVVSYNWRIFVNNLSHLISENESGGVEISFWDMIILRKTINKKTISMLALSLLWMWLVLYRQGVVHAQTKLTFRNIHCCFSY